MLLGVSDDTVRRWVTNGRVESTVDDSGRQSIEGVKLARLAQEIAGGDDDGRSDRSSARNRATGLVTRVMTDKVMAQVDIQCGPYRFVSLMSAEAVAELGLQVGDTATAVVKATNVIVEKETT